MNSFFKISTFVLTLVVTSVHAQPLVYVSSGERVKNKYPFAGGVSCCGCNVKHYGNLPSDFPAGDVKAITFYLTSSRSNSYYTKIKAGPTKLKFIIGGQESFATSNELTAESFYPVKHKWTLCFNFSPPINVKPETMWQLLDGDNNIYSAVMLHSSDTGEGGGLPGIDEQTGCQYNHKVSSKYTMKFDFAGTVPLQIADSATSNQMIRKSVLKTSVVEFTERGDLGIQDAGAIIAEWMTTSLKKTGVFEVYERLSLEKLMEEHKLGMSGIMDEETIAKIGKMHGVQAIVTGSVIKFGDIISVTAKLIDTETAKIIDSADIKVTDVNLISTYMDILAAELAHE